MKKINLLVLIFLLISLLLILADKKGWTSTVKNFVARPIVWMEKGIFRGYQEALKSIKSITGITGSTREKEITLLEGKLRQLAVEQNQLSVCWEENEHFRKLLGAPLPAQWRFMEAKVVGISEKMKIDKGEKDGVKEGMMVVSENILLGKVVAVEENTSLVQLVNDPNLKIPVVVKKPNTEGIQARGLLVGQGGGVILDRVLQSEDIQKGDLVVTTGEEGWLPDLLIGQIEEVSPKSAEVYQKARVLPLIDGRKLRIVFIIIK